jgi:hypothetical protein
MMKPPPHSISKNIESKSFFVYKRPWPSNFAFIASCQSAESGGFSNKEKPWYGSYPNSHSATRKDEVPVRERPGQRTLIGTCFSLPRLSIHVCCCLIKGTLGRGIVAAEGPWFRGRVLRLFSSSIASRMIMLVKVLRSMARFGLSERPRSTSKQTIKSKQQCERGYVWVQAESLRSTDPYQITRYCTKYSYLTKKWPTVQVLEQVRARSH